MSDQATGRGQAALIRESEHHLGEALRPLAEELRLVDVADYVAFIRLDLFANVRDLVESSIEPFFRPGILRYAFGARCHLQWDQIPLVAFDLEFRHHGLLVCFELILEGPQTRVAIQQFRDDEAESRSGSAADALQSALRDAASPPRE